MSVRRYEVYDFRIVPFGAGLCRYCFVPWGGEIVEFGVLCIIVRSLHLEQFSVCFGYFHCDFCPV